MKGRSLVVEDAYTRKETAEIFDVCERTLKRMEGDELHALTHPDDPHKRVFYARSEVDRLARRLGRRLPSEARRAPPATARGTSELIPGRKVARAFAMLGDGHTKAELCVELELSLEQGELLEEKFVAWQGRRAVAVAKDQERASSRATNSSRAEANPGRLILVEDSEMLAWQDRIDEENRWAEDDNAPSASPTDGEEGPRSASETEDGEDGPPSSRAASARK